MLFYLNNLMIAVRETFSIISPPTCATCCRTRLFPVICSVLSHSLPTADTLPKYLGEPSLWGASHAPTPHPPTPSVIHFQSSESLFPLPSLLLLFYCSSLSLSLFSRLCICSFPPGLWSSGTPESSSTLLAALEEKYNP